MLKWGLFRMNTDISILKSEALAALASAYKKNKQGRLLQSRRIFRTTARKRKSSGSGEILLTLVWRTPSGSTTKDEELVAVPSNRWQDFDVITMAVANRHAELKRNVVEFPAPLERRSA